MGECPRCDAMSLVVADAQREARQACEATGLQRTRAEAAEEQVRYEQERDHNNVTQWQAERDAWKADAERLAETLIEAKAALVNAARLLREALGTDVLPAFMAGMVESMAKREWPALAAHEVLKAKEKVG